MNRARHGVPYEGTVGCGQDLDVHPVTAVLPKVVRTVGRHPIDTDQGAVQDQEQVAGRLGRTWARSRVGARRTGDFTLSVMYGQADTESGGKVGVRFVVTQVDQDAQGLSGGV